MNACEFVCERIKKQKYSKELTQTVYLSHMTHKRGKTRMHILHWFRHAALLRNVNASSPVLASISYPHISCHSLFFPLSSCYIQKEQQGTLKGYYLFTQAPNPFDFLHTRNFQHKRLRLIGLCQQNYIKLFVACFAKLSKWNNQWMAIKVHKFLFETDESESRDVLLHWLLYASQQFRN